MKDLRKELEALYLDLDLVQREYCSKEEEAELAQLLEQGRSLPDDVQTSSSNGLHFRFVKTDLTPEERKDLFECRRLKYLGTIRNCALCFTVLSIIGIVAALIALF